METTFATFGRAAPEPVVTLVSSSGERLQNCRGRSLKMDKRKKHLGGAEKQRLKKSGAPHSSVGSVRDPCAEALQRTRVRLPARVPLLRVTPRLLPCFLSTSPAVLSIKPEKAKKILKKVKVSGGGGF